MIHTYADVDHYEMLVREWWGMLRAGGVIVVVFAVAYTVGQGVDWVRRRANRRKEGR